MPREHLIPDHRWCVPRSKSLLPHTLAVCASVIAAALIVAQAMTTRPLLKVETLPPPLAFANVPCDAQANEPPLAGPFRPRPPKPEPPVPPAPAPENDAERKLFPRIEALIEARAQRVEARAEAKAEQRVEAALNEVTANMDAAMQGADPELMQGAFGGVFVAKLIAFVKKAVMFVVSAVILTTLGALIVHYWFIVGPVALFLFVALPAWSARTFQKKA